MKTFKIVRLPNKDVLYIVHYREDASFNLRFTYNSISGGYMGTSIDGGFIETIRGLLRTLPHFFENFDGSDPKRSLLDAGFIEIQPTKMDLLLHNIEAVTVPV